MRDLQTVRANCEHGNSVCARPRHRHVTEAKGETLAQVFLMAAGIDGTME